MPARIGSATRRSARSRGRLAVGHLPMRLINRTPSRSGWLALAILPFALLLALYLTSSTKRLEINPNDKLLPSFGQMSAAVERLAFTPDKRSGEFLFWQDTASSLKRLGTGLAIAAVAGLCLGIVAGTLPLFSAPLSPLLTVLSMVPPLAILAAVLVLPTVAFWPLAVVTVPLMLLTWLAFKWVAASVVAPWPVSVRAWTLAFVDGLAGSPPSGGESPAA